MTTGLLLTRPFSDRAGKASDEAEAWAIWTERALREMRFRDDHDEVPVQQITLRAVVAARDAGDVCHVCGNLVTWVDHLPPRDPGGAVRCFANVETLYVNVPGIDTPVFRALVDREV